MSVQSRKLASRITSALRNDSLVITTAVNREYVTIADPKAEVGFAIITPHADGYTLHGWDGFAKTYGALEFRAMLADIKTLPGYAAPKVHKVNATPRIRHTKMTGVSMGRFIPGNLSAIGE
jgi:hypothetical protein